VKVHASALKHGVSAEDALDAATHCVFVSELDEDSPAREFRLGFDLSSWSSGSIAAPSS